MTIDLTEIIIAVIGLCGAVITGFLIPWLKSQTNVEQQETIEMLAKTAVFAAQQIFTTEQAQDKKKFAVTYMQELMERYNIKIDLPAVSAAVEAALKEAKTTVIAQGGEW